MSKRFYLSPVSIVQTDDGPTAVTKAVGNYAHTAHAQVVALNSNGTLRLPWGLCAIEAINHLPIMSDPEIRVLPDFPFDAQMGSLQPGALLTLRRAMQTFGIDDQGAIGNDLAAGYRLPIRNLGRLLDSAFSENNFL